MIRVDIGGSCHRGMGIRKASKTESNDVLFHIPFICYSSTGYIETLIILAYSLIYARFKNLEFLTKNT